jgi:HEAT repeat protein
MSQTPHHASLEAVRRAMHDRDPEVASASTLAAGNLARQLAENDPDTAKDVVGDLLARLDRAASVDEQVLVLRALGNSGDLRVLPYAERFLMSSADVVRAASCDALTFVKSEAADNMLVRALSRDESEMVRGSAVRVSAQRPFEAYFAPLARVLGEDPAASVRLAAVERLGLAAQDPRVLEVLRRAMQDANEDVRNAATAIVSPAPAAPAKP